ncbi:TetR/AcrR family transcriptional regulator (plasmid) [Streptomyces sp. NBC_00536]|uniref:TetR/AcrR family transcriptional regulator n=1 Tax=Streptomyces sp. NBC_00536 TaxID=2975769 RepID=UPI002E818F87|nr:helix-turn-helix domain-containing protein [Streptomyces sp. NBC_00536]WUC84231.1 TetR/AcrR family transcriptional regulator [Streptomyces sp. NBC_00536]
MARPPRFDTDQILDAAVQLAASTGPAGVTMSAVAQAIGAPSGSMYHRFPGRTALLAEVWLRTVERFQEGYFIALGSAPEPRGAARAAARHVVSWSRAHPQEASLLLYGAEQFGRADWSAEHRERADRGNEHVFDSLHLLAEVLGAKGPMDHERVILALIDLPLSLVRRHLRAGHPLPPHAEALAEESAAALLTAD